MKKIIFVAPRYHTNQVPIVKALQNEGYEVFYLVNHIGGTEDHKLLVPILLDKFTPLKTMNKISFPSITHLKKIIKEIEPDYIIFRDLNLTSLFTYFLNYKIKKSPQKILYTQNSVYRENLSSKKNKMKMLVYRYFYKKIDCYSPVLFSDVTRKNLKQPLIKEKLNFIPLIAEERSNVKSREYLKNDKINILSVGKYRNYKNHYILIDAFLRLTQDQKEKFFITIIGESYTQSEKTYFNNLNSYIEEKKIGNYFSLIKNINHEKMSEFYLDNDVFILTSKKEVASVAILESMSFGMVPISTSVNGTASYINDDIGYIFESNNIDSLSKVLTKVIQNERNLSYMGKMSYKHISENYSKNDFLKAFSKLLK